MMNIIANSTWGKLLIGKLFSGMLKKKGINAKVKINDFKADAENEYVVLKVNLEATMTKTEIDKLVDSIM